MYDLAYRYSQLIMEIDLNKNLNSTELLKYNSISLILCNHNKINEILKRVSKKTSNFNQNIRFFNNLIENNKVFNSYEKKLFNFINNKRVLIIGSKKTDETFNKIVKNYDVIVGFNIKNNSFIFNNINLDKKIVISFINQGQLESLLNNQNLVGIPDYVDFNIVRNQDHSFALSKITSSEILVENNFDEFFQHKLTGVPRSIFYLIVYNPKSIHVCNSDLMLTKDRNPHYFDGIKNIDKPINFSWVYGAYSHNLLLQFSILRLFHNNGYITVDARLNEILDKGIKNYALKMQNQNIRLGIMKKSNGK